MLKLKDLKEGDHVIAEYEGQRIEGIVRELHRDDDNEVCVETAVQTFWFKPEHLSAIPLDEAQLLKLGFSRKENEDGTVKYLKGPFRLLIASAGDFSHVEIWYREDRRKLNAQISVSELQHHYHDMAKVDLVRDDVINESL
jgi:hypothetical protein